MCDIREIYKFFVYRYDLCTKIFNFSEVWCISKGFISKNRNEVIFPKFPGPLVQNG